MNGCMKFSEIRSLNAFVHLLHNEWLHTGNFEKPFFKVHRNKTPRRRKRKLVSSFFFAETICQGECSCSSLLLQVRKCNFSALGRRNIRNSIYAGLSSALLFEYVRFFCLLFQVAANFFFFVFFLFFFLKCYVSIVGRRTI